MKKQLILCLLCLAVLVSCSSQVKEVDLVVEERPPEAAVKNEKEPMLRFTDILGKEYSMEDSVDVLQPFVYGRRTSGYFVDNVTNPELFDAEGFHGSWEAQGVEYQWKHYSQSQKTEDEGFTIGYAEVCNRVYPDGTTEIPEQQSLWLSSVKLKGILHYATEDRDYGSAYALNERKGEVFFYPYPEDMGDFPFIELGGFSGDGKQSTGGFAPLLIRGAKSDYQAWADTVRLQVTDLSQEQIQELFADSDLIEAEVLFDRLKMEYAYCMPLTSETVTASVEKIADC